MVDVNDLLAVISSWGPCSVGNLDADQDGWTVEDGDCDDTNPNVHPGAIEVCNGIDDDCDGEIDEDAVACTIWYRDMDGDGYGDCNDYVCACQPIAPYTTLTCGDCDDTDPYIHPAALEICNFIDDNCDGVIDENALDCMIWYRDMDRDGFGYCNDYVCACYPLAPYDASICDDCDDTNPFMFPGAIEICNGIDDNCDGDIDEGC